MSSRAIRISNQGSSPAPESITREECLAAWDAVAKVIPGWSAEIQDNPIGQLSLYIVPPDAADDAGPMLILYKMASMFILDQFWWDRYDCLGEFTSIDEAVSAIRTVLRGALAVLGNSAKGSLNRQHRSR